VRHRTIRASLAAALLLTAAAAAAQPAGPTPRAPAEAPRRAPLANVEDVDPAVDVGERRVAVINRGKAPPAVAQAAPPAVPSAPPQPAQSPESASAAPPQASAPAAPRTGTPQRAIDSIDLGTTSITGNQELPKVLYIVPWKKSDLGDLVGRPVNTLLDEVLAPVDPEVFERHLEYYETLYGKSKEE
jgi:hypothetical protein